MAGAPHFRIPKEPPRGPRSFRRISKQTTDGLRLTWRTVKLVWRSSPLATGVLAALTLVSAVLPLGVAYAGKGIVDGVVATSGHATMRWVLIELGIVAGQALTQRGLGFVRSLLGARL